MSPLFEYLLRLGDNSLVLGHRLSEWCGHGPVLEEDIALANTALDMIGQCQLWLNYAAEVEAKGRTADDLAYLRDAWHFRNVLLVEQPNADFGVTLMRQFLFDAFHVPQLQALETSSDQRIADIASKCVKEALYHLQRSQELVIALGDGTEESHLRMQNALERLWPFAGEMFVVDNTDNTMHESGTGVDLAAVHAQWTHTVESTFESAQLRTPDSDFSHQGGKNGRQHSEHLGHMLATLQVLQRSFPGAQW